MIATRCERSRPRNVKIKALLGQTKISAFPIESDQSVITIPERHSRIKTTSAFIEEIQNKIQKLRKTREFWSEYRNRKSSAKKQKRKKESIKQELIRRHGVRLTSGEIFSLPFNEERMRLEKEMLKEYLTYHDNLQATKIQKVFRGFMIRKYYFKRLHESTVREFMIKRSVKIIQREWKIFRFQLQMKRYVKERRDRALAKIQKVLRGYIVWINTGAIRTTARMNALKKTLFLTVKKNKAAKIIQRWFRKSIKTIRRKRREREAYLKWVLAKQLEDEKNRENRFDPNKFKIVNRGGILKRINIEEERKEKLKEKYAKENETKKKAKKKKNKN